MTGPWPKATLWAQSHGPFRSRPTDRNFSLVSLGETGVSTACKCRFTVPFAAPRDQLKTGFLWLFCSGGSELMATPALCPRPQSLPVSVPRRTGHPCLLFHMSFSFSEDAPCGSFLDSVSLPVSCRTPTSCSKAPASPLHPPIRALSLASLPHPP